MTTKYNELVKTAQEVIDGGGSTAYIGSAKAAKALVEMNADLVELIEASEKVLHLLYSVTKGMAFTAELAGIVSAAQNNLQASINRIKEGTAMSKVNMPRPEVFDGIKYNGEPSSHSYTTSQMEEYAADKVREALEEAALLMENTGKRIAAADVRSLIKDDEENRDTALPDDQPQNVSKSMKLLDVAVDKAWIRFQQASLPTSDEIEEFAAKYADEQGHIHSDSHAAFAHALLDAFSQRYVCASSSDELPREHAVPEAEKQSCQEADGCPTELAVLQRYWRQHQLQQNEAALVIKNRLTPQQVEEARRLFEIYVADTNTPEQTPGYIKSLLLRQADNDGYVNRAIDNDWGTWLTACEYMHERAVPTYMNDGHFCKYASAAELSAWKRGWEAAQRNERDDIG